MNWDHINKSYSYTNLISIILLFCLGSIAGSFYHCIAMRIINGEDWKSGRSHCDLCGHVLTVGDLIPIISFLLLKGRCRYCRGKLSYKYLLIELLLGFIYVLTYLYFQRINISLFCLLNFFGLLVGLSLVDLESYIIPDGFIVVGVINRFIDPTIYLNLIYGICRVFEAFQLAGMVYLFAWLMNKINKKENFGGGDIKLIFVIGLYTGFYYGVWVLLGSCLIGLVYALHVKKRRIPFGPFLSVSAMFVLLYRGLI